MLLVTVRKTLASERAEAMRKAEECMKAAAADGREFSSEEKTQIEAHLTEARRIKARLDALDGDDTLRAELVAFQGQAGAQFHPVVTGSSSTGAERQGPRLSMGQQFIASAMYREGIIKQPRPRGWRSGAFELEVPGPLATTTSGAMSFPTYQPSIYGPGAAKTVVGDLFAQGTTDGNAVIYMQESAFVNAAATVAEGAAKPESTLTFNQVTDLVKKIATWLGVTDEMLDDAAQLQSYIDSRLRSFIETEEEDQLLNGDGLGSNLTGIRNRVGLAPDIVRVGVDENNADAIYRQIAAIASASLLMPDGIVMHPANWAPMATLKTVDGVYISAGPFAPAQTPTMWGLSVVLTSQIPAGTALVGAFKVGGQVFRKGGIAVEASNSHADYFIKNLTAIRAEERLALAVYRPAGFGEVTSLLGATGVVLEAPGGDGGRGGKAETKAEKK